MKHIKLTIEFNVSEKEFQKKGVQDFIKHFKSGEAAKELQQNPEFDMKDFNTDVKIS